MHLVTLDHVHSHVLRVEARASHTRHSQEDAPHTWRSRARQPDPPRHSLATSGLCRPSLSQNRRGKREQGRLPPVAAASENEVEAGSAESAALEMERLQGDLEQAVHSEDYSAAASIRDKLRVLQENEEASVIASNSMFYRAFQSGNMRQMRQVWAREEYVQCMHPGTHCIQGYDMVMESWDVVLQGERRLSIDVENVRCHVQGSMAFVTCVEALRSDGASGRVIATNIFEKRNGKWSMILHQGAAAPSQNMF